MRSAVYAAPNRGFARRLADHLAFCASALATAPATGPADVVVVETPPLFTAAAGAIYAALKRAPLVVNVADRWPESAIELGALSQPHAIRAAEALERWIYRRAAADHRADRRACCATSAPSRTPPGGSCACRRPSTPRASPASARPHGRRRPAARPLRGHGRARARHLDAGRGRRAAPGRTWSRSRSPAAAPRRAQLSNGVPDNVRSLGIVPPDAIPGLYAQADAGVVLLLDRPILAGALPTKLLECLAAGPPGRPVRARRGRDADLSVGRGHRRRRPRTPTRSRTAFRTLHGDPALRSRLGDAGREVIAERLRPPGLDPGWADTLERVVRQRARL